MDRFNHKIDRNCYKREFPQADTYEEAVCRCYNLSLTLMLLYYIIQVSVTAGETALAASYSQEIGAILLVS